MYTHTTSHAIHDIASAGLHEISLERDSCGTGFLVNINQIASRALVESALTVLVRLDHRGARGADPKTGDGVGVMTSLPHDFFAKQLAIKNKRLPKPGEYAVAQVFFSQDERQYTQEFNHIQTLCKAQNIEVFHIREVPTDNVNIGSDAQRAQPRIMQLFLRSDNLAGFELRIYLVQKQASTVLRSKSQQFFICSASLYSIVYKGMLTTEQLQQFYLDLQDPDYTAHVALVHSRFSTNTFPSWERAQPQRFMSHNGEINTLYGNIHKMNARHGVMKSRVFKDALASLYPVIEPEMSDSGAFDNVLEFLYYNGYSIPQALCMMIPQAWQHDTRIAPSLRAMYEVYSTIMEPWDGPACITFFDGRYVGAVVDRNGLRPSRYYLTKDGLVVLASEFGVVDIDPKDIVKKDRIQPGKIFLIDTHEHRLIEDQEFKAHIAQEHPYQDWLKAHTTVLKSTKSIQRTTQHTKLRSLLYGYTEEDKLYLIKAMVELKKEPIGSMGNDVALACLSEKPRLLYDYFKQWFAQVTNPPIDSIRERVMMSLGTYIGPEGNLLEMKESHCQRLWLDNPVLTPSEFSAIRDAHIEGWRSKTIDICFSYSDRTQKTTSKEGEQTRKHLTHICEQAEAACDQGYQIIILSDDQMSEQHVPLSSLLVTSTVHHYLIKKAKRSRIALVLESGEPREVHHYCLLLGYGIDAIYPYLVYQNAYVLRENGILSQKFDDDDIEQHYRKAVDYGICKVLAKMGISTLESYKGAQIFEAIGLGEELIKECFEGTISRIGGIGFAHLERETIERHKEGISEWRNLIGEDVYSLGSFQWRKDGHLHMWDPESITLLQHAVRYNSQKSYDSFAKHQDAQCSRYATIRGLFDFIKRNPIPLSEVEPASNIVKRFATGAMSYGSISLEAHETLAIAMNRIGAKSNTGEGGELSNRFTPLSNGDSKRSAIKQVASGRFGVTIEYLSNSDEIQIKMAQGAKPGEGGELPGRKVQEDIAKTRHSTPGIGLISPPPHHDIYSIEDLAQLIYDLKNANPKARISVKLVSKAGVGVIAAGVAKGKADHILISGHDGGTGASPLTSIKHAGIPWELGLAETHQVLVRNKLRSRVVIQTDGQLKTGRDIVMAALLGAEEFGFATAPLIAMGCIMMRKCELNTCPVGVATQDEQLRKRFAGRPEHVVRLMNFLAEDVRNIMARLGFRTIAEMVGCSHILTINDDALTWKSRTLNLDALLYPNANKQTSSEYIQSCTISQDHGLSDVLDKTLLKDSIKAIETGKKITIHTHIKNTDRTTGAMVSNHIALRYGIKGLPEDTIHIACTGHAGQSFGAFLAHGIHMSIVGDANDYFGKGLSGGVLSLISPKPLARDAHKQIIVGNVGLYGSVLGKVFVNGRAAERFAIRNSGAQIVVEGLGAHGCEYMTGGRMIVLGEIGQNFAAGMSGGIAYLWEHVANEMPEGKAEEMAEEIPESTHTHSPQHSLKNGLARGRVEYTAKNTISDNMFENHINFEIVRRFELTEHDKQYLHAMIHEHHQRTGSLRAASILQDWARQKNKFIKITSQEYISILELQNEKVLSQVS